MTKKKKCPVCESEVKGRSDKLFCSMKCKSINQYEKRQEKEQFYLRVDSQLKINRKLVYDKYDGHCAYCGEKINYEEL